MKVLIADDQAEVCSALKVLFQHLEGNYDIDEANELESMLYKVQYNQPDMLLLDWELSNMSMGDLIPRLRKLASRMFIIAMSGRPEALKEATDAGVNIFVSKGENPGRLLDVINDIRMAVKKEKNIK